MPASVALVLHAGMPVLHTTWNWSLQYAATTELSDAPHTEVSAALEHTAAGDCVHARHATLESLAATVEVLKPVETVLVHVLDATTHCDGEHDEPLRRLGNSV